MTFADTPFSSIPRRMLVELMYGRVFWYNMVIPTDYVSTTIGPGSIVLGRIYDYNSIAGDGTKFGEYVETHEKTDNTLKERTVTAICLRPSGNTQGSFYYYSLVTGKRLHRRRCTAKPMPQTVIDRVHAIAKKQKSPKGLTFTRSDGTPYPDTDLDEHEEHITPNIEQPGQQVEQLAGVDDIDIQDEQLAGVDDADAQDEQLARVDDTDTQEEFFDTLEETQLENPNERDNCNNEGAQPAVIDETPDDENQEESEMETHKDNQLEQKPDIDEDEHKGQEQSQYVAPYRTTRSGRQVKPREIFQKNDEYHFGTVIQSGSNDEEIENIQDYTYAQNAYIDSVATYSNIAVQFPDEHLIFTQMGMKAGIKLWGKKGMGAIMKEMKQFHDRNVVRPLLPNDITHDIKKNALAYLMFLKMKRNGDIKERGCADGRPQRIYKSKEETYSPTVATESIFITAMIDAQEGRDVAHVDIPGAFLQTAASEGTFIKLKGAMVETLLKINPTWKQYVIYETRNKTPTIYSEAIKAFYMVQLTQPKCFMITYHQHLLMKWVSKGINMTCAW